ncbi:bile acid:sodium symporter family protein [Emticicia sp. 21SJ11W-3]|uniref:bile acid:sodium symporter family protein n=1 Tax=Emticicia sp. 21SJ11W-3 TaxID=2916755 RepID=UPI00209F29FF|nr:bile acid:sodium symporter family protein [Emticicia sp. 21SJ11W-3]UTA68340.1 bile acid:sodium symporter [Emticicia sp. 21SJ11W-3]
MNKISNFFSRIGLDWFLGAIILMVVLAYYFPSFGIMQEPFSLEELANYGVSGIFFFYGLKLSIDKLKKGLANWKMHLVIQLTTFVLFPLIALLVKPLFKGADTESLWLGIFYLAALPSTVSSSVVMVSMANGNVPSAIFNASISSLIGLFMTPLWVGIFVAADTGGFDTQSIVIKLCLQVLLPLVIGLLLNKRLGWLADKHKTALKNFDQSIILVIIYTSFCKSFALNLFRDLSFIELILLMAGLLGLFFSVIIITRFIAKLLGFDMADTITVMFCGSKKSLVHGTVMSKVLFTQSSIIGIILLPLMVYHALQLIAASIMAQKFAKAQQ